MVPAASADGVGVATSVLPLLIKSFPSETKRIKETLLFALFNEHSIGMGQSFSDNAVSAILDGMWKDYPVYANSLFLGYVLLKPKLDGIRTSIREETRKRNIFQFSENAVRGRFVKSHKAEIENIIANKITYDELPAVDTVNARVLVTGFSLLPLWTGDEHHKSFVQSVCELLSKKLLDRDKEERFDYTLRHRFFDKLSHFVLTSEKSDIQRYLRPFLEHFRGSREMADTHSSPQKTSCINMTSSGPHGSCFIRASRSSASA